MDLLIALEQRFLRTPDGCVWTQTSYERSFWSRYLSVFSRIRVLARVLDVVSIEGTCKRVDGDGVTVAPVPYYVGPWEYARVIGRVHRTISAVITPGDAVILRVPGTISTIAAKRLAAMGYPFGIEVVGDPYDTFAPGALDHPLRPLFRWWFSRTLRRQCAQAPSSLYVTERALQRRYPPTGYSTNASNVELCDSAFVVEPVTPRPFTVGVSDVELPHEAFTAAPRGAVPVVERPVRLICVGNFEVLYKAQDILIKAVAECVAGGLNLELILVGDGRQRPALEALARDSGVRERVRFLGQLSAGALVRAQLDLADLFVLPSRQEGVPRAMIEAMARALPCIGSTVGGIPELLPDEALVPPNDVVRLAAKIREVTTDAMLRARMSAANLRTARRYHDSKLQANRVEFYSDVARRTRDWLEGTGRPHRPRLDEVAA